VTWLYHQNGEKAMTLIRVLVNDQHPAAGFAV
jgi:hypothetical protein